MKKSIKATSIIEAIVVLLIIVTWVTWMYTIFSKSTKLSNSTANKIQAIQIAKQWIEAFTNIRDTNWIRFSSDSTNCWNTLNYNSNCIWDITTTYDIQSWSYIIYRNSNNAWVLDSKTTNTFWNWNYNTDFIVWIDDKWIYTQSWAVNDTSPKFTRELKISYLDEDWITSPDTNSPKIKIISLVQWIDSSSNQPHKVELEQILSNWKK